MSLLRLGRCGWLAAAMTLALHAACSDSSGSDAAAGSTGASASSTSSGGPTVPRVEQALDLLNPLDGEVVQAGDTLDVRVSVPKGLTPQLFVGDEDTEAVWAPDPTDPSIRHTKFTIPADAAGPLSFLARDAASGGLPASAIVSVLTPADQVTATIGSGDTVLVLASGAKLTIPAGALDSGEVRFESYDQAAIATFAKAKMFSPIYRIHLSADPSALHREMHIDQPINKAQVDALLATPSSLALDGFEGNEPDDESMPASAPAQVETLPDGSGIVHAELSPEGFHASGSSTAICGLRDHPYPFEYASADLCAVNDADAPPNAGPPPPNCAPLDPATPPIVKLSRSTSGTGAHVQVKAKVAWKYRLPPFGPPGVDNLSTPYPTSPFNPLRETYVKGDSGPTHFRPHEGNDLRVGKTPATREPTIVKAVAGGTATLEMGSQFHVDIDLDDPPPLITSHFMVRYLHLSKFLGFEQDFPAGKVIGRSAAPEVCMPVKNKKGKTVTKCTVPDVVAPTASRYGLVCDQKGSKMLCSLVSAANPPDAALDDQLGAGGCGMPKPLFCLVKMPRGNFVRHVDPGAVVGVSGTTGTVAPHLHLEMAYGDWGADLVDEDFEDGTPIDLAFVYPTIAGAASFGEGETGLRSAMLRFAAELTPGNGASGTAIAGAVPGIDPTSVEKSLPASCPYGGTIPNAPNTGYSFVKIGGPDQDVGVTTVAWDLGPCVYQSACGANTNVNVALGTTTWRWDSLGDQQWQLLSQLPANADKSGYYDLPPAKQIIHDLYDRRSGTIACCDEATDPTCVDRTPKASDFEGMTVTVQGTNEFGMATMTLTNVAAVASAAAYMGSFNGPEAGNNPAPNGSTLLSKTLPANALLFTFGDKVQPACVVGFPATFTPNNTANRCGRSNLLALWKDAANKWQWAFNVSGGSYNSGGGFPQWHEYQFIYDSRNGAANMPPKNRYDVYLGANAMAGGWSYIRTLPTTVSVIRKKTGYVLPDSQTM